MHNQKLFYNVNILKNYCDYLLHIYNNYEILCSNSVESVKFINIDIVSWTKTHDMNFKILYLGRHNKCTQREKLFGMEFTSQLVWTKNLTTTTIVGKSYLFIFEHMFITIIYCKNYAYILSCLFKRKIP